MLFFFCTPYWTCHWTFYRHYQNVAENVYERGAATAKSVNYKHSKKLLSTHVGVVSFNPQIRQAIYVKNVKEKLTKGTKFNSIKVSKD